MGRLHRFRQHQRKRAARCAAWRFGLPVALAEYNGKLYMAWKGMEGDDRIFWSTFDGKSWAAQQQVSGVSTSGGPALAVFDGKLYMAWKGTHPGNSGFMDVADDKHIWYSYFDGSKWAAQKQVPGVATSIGPSLGVHFDHGVDKLYMAWKGMEGDQRIWYSFFDGSKWAAEQAVPGVSTSVGPCITTFNGELHMAWKGMYGDQRIWFSHFDGVRWRCNRSYRGGNQRGSTTVPLQWSTVCRMEGRTSGCGIRITAARHGQRSSRLQEFPAVWERR